MIIQDFLIALYSMGFMGIGQYMILLILSGILLIRKQLILHTDFWILLLFSGVYFLFSGISTGNFSYNIFFAPLAYLVGLNYRAKSDPSVIARLILLLAIFFASHGVLNFLYDTAINGGLNSSSALHNDIWSKSYTSVTGQMMEYIILAAMTGYAVFVPKKRWLYPLLAFSMFHTIIVGGRTLIVLMPISLLIGCITYFTVCKENRGRKLCSFFITLVLLCGIVYLAYNRNILGIKDTFESSYLYRRLFSDYASGQDMSFFQTNRWEIKWEFVKLLPYHLLGGRHIHHAVGYYAHDIWLDTYDTAGIFAFAILVIYIGKMLRRYITMLRSGTTSWEMKIMLNCFYIIVMIYFFIEPVLQCGPYIVFAVFMVDGCVTNYLSNPNASLPDCEAITL